MASTEAPGTWDVSQWSRYLPAEGRLKQIAVSGAGGLVGSSLLPLCVAGGLHVTRLTRGKPGRDAVNWDPQSDSFDATPLDGIDGVVHLAGENIAGARWNPTVKARIRDSRVHGTEILCQGLARMPAPPKVLVCASAVGFYGDRGDELLTEESARGTGFLADVAHDWEQATAAASAAGIRVVKLRFGVILSPHGGALQKMLTPFKLGVGGRVGSGRQFMSWISIVDAVGSILHCLMSEELVGPVNAVAPDPVTNAEFTRELGRALHRPTIFPMPAFAARLALGEMADALLLASVRVRPNWLLATHYEFRHPDLPTVFQALLA